MIPDFSGWATVANVKCADGRTIMPHAFKENDGETVPMVWMHNSKDPKYVIGHALLTNCNEGVRCDCFLNDSEYGKLSKNLVKNGDINSLSIMANNLVERSKNVIHGVIREVSLCTAGANPKAKIDRAVIAHSAEYGDIYEPPEDGFFIDVDVLAHSDVGDIYATEGTMYFYQPLELHHSMDDDKPKHDGQAIWDSMTDEQKDLVHYMLTIHELEKDESEGEDSMKHNLFEGEAARNQITAEDMKTIFNDAKRIGSLKETVLEHMDHGILAHSAENEDGSTQSYGIADIDYLFPDYKSLDTPPAWIKRKTDWVSTVMGGVHHTPYSRIKSMFADITADDSRALGYIKGNLKKEEVFRLLKRTTDPQTVYKKQKMDKDDINDITDFNVVSWVKTEMRGMLDEELARAYLFGDGRSTLDQDHISHDHIRPVISDSDLFTIKVTAPTGDDDAATAKNALNACIRGQDEYEGSGSKIGFMPQKWVTELLLLEDGFGHPLYANREAIANKMLVDRIVSVPVMKGMKDENEDEVFALILDLKDYNVGADKGGAVNMFEDFDIDYNQEKYLIETRCSGALIKPYSAVRISLKKGGEYSTTGGVMSHDRSNFYHPNKAAADPEP